MLVSNNLSKQWRPIEKWLFYLVGVYVVLYILPFPFSFIGVVPEVGNFYKEYTWDLLIPWFGKTIIGLDSVNTQQGGSGDTTYFWIQYLILIILATLGAFVLFLTRRKQVNENRWLLYVSTYLIYFVIFSMLTYGFAKVIKLQFQDPSLTRLLQPYGHSSPMRLAWTFMGQSTAYTFFAGASELIAGILLIFRKTRTLGAMIGAGVMLNIFMMNMSYDIPVKLYSFNLLIFCSMIILLDWRRVSNFLFLNRPTHSATSMPWTSSDSLNKGLRLTKFLIIGIFLVYSFVQGKRMQKQYGLGNEPLPALFGIYDVIEYQLNGEIRPPLLTDTLRWRKVVIDKLNMFSYQLMDSHINQTMQYDVDTIKQRIEMTRFTDTIPSYTLIYNQVDDTLYVDGTGLGDTLAMKWQTVDLDQFLLRNRGFHWINEFPYNR